MSSGVKSMLNLHSDDRIYNPLPLYHTAGGILGAGQALIGYQISTLHCTIYLIADRALLNAIQNMRDYVKYFFLYKMCMWLRIFEDSANIFELKAYRYKCQLSQIIFQS